jgi:hypothetical protein
LIIFTVTNIKIIILKDTREKMKTYAELMEKGWVSVEEMLYWLEERRAKQTSKRKNKLKKRSGKKRSVDSSRVRI